MKAHHVPCGPAVNESERKAFERLKARLNSEPGDDEWLLLTNLAFSATHRRQSDEIDIVAIGLPGVQVIEVKHWTETWVKRNSELVEQEADHVTGKARKIGATLRKRVENLPQVAGVFLVTQAAAKAEERAAREWKSLQRLQQHGWAPRIVDSFQDAPGYPGEIKFFTLADPAAPSIEERRADAAWDTDARLAFARDAVRALQELHEEDVGGQPMVHRNLTPGTILVKHDNSPMDRFKALYFGEGGSRPAHVTLSR